ncbi:MAG: HEAT repeat domain-containing protein, partial [Candidatus Freyarchaeota archaeon]
VGLVEEVSARYEYYLDVFFIACYILGRLRDPVSIPCLVSKLEKFGEILSRQSERGMERWERYLTRIARFPLKSAVDALIRIGKEAVQPLIGLLSSEHPETRKYAAYALGKIGSRAAIPALRNIFQNGEEAE